MDIDIREEWFGIANGINSLTNDDVKICFSSISSEHMDEFEQMDEF